MVVFFPWKTFNRLAAFEVIYTNHCIRPMVISTMQAMAIYPMVIEVVTGLWDETSRQVLVPVGYGCFLKWWVKSPQIIPF